MIRERKSSDLPELIAIAKSWPQHFTEEGLSYIESDAVSHDCCVFEEASGGGILGFLVWTVTAHEIELLWLAVLPKVVRRGIGYRLVAHVLNQATTQRVALLKTASLKSRREGTALNGSSYRGTYDFFHSLGFSEIAQIDSFWGPEEHCVLLGKKLGDGGEGILSTS